MSRQMKLNRLVMIEECPWNERDYEEGDTVYEYTGYAYGCISAGGMAVTENPNNQNPFFELPRDALDVKET